MSHQECLISLVVSDPDRIIDSETENLFVSGSCVQLGNWMPNNAIILQKNVEKRTWSVDLSFSNLETIYFRFFTGNLTGNKCIVIRRWEASLKPRMINLNDFQQNKVLECKFGYSGNTFSLQKGWLTCQSEVQFRFYGSQLYSLFGDKSICSIKCTPFIIKPNSSENSIGILPFNDVTISVLNSAAHMPCSQGAHGAHLNHDNTDYIIFRSQFLPNQQIGYQFDIYTDAKAPVLLGTFYFSSVQAFEDSQGVHTAPILSSTHGVLGHLSVDYLIIHPMVAKSFDMSHSYSSHWKKRDTLEIGHRGLGRSHCPSNEQAVASVTENTIASFQQAFYKGADFVETDVQLSNDLVPLIYHDFSVLFAAVNGRSSQSIKNNESSEQWIKVPIDRLKFSEIQNLKLNGDNETDDLRPLPSLRSVLSTVHLSLGLNLEIKYCLLTEAGVREDCLIDSVMDRNLYVDRILKEVFEFAGDRRIIFSCFDPDICTMVKLKQNVYPVLLLTQGKTKKWPRYGDKRTWTVESSAFFANSEDFLGINAHAEDLINEPCLVKCVKDLGLVCFSWGNDLNIDSNKESLHQLGVDACIHDRISNLPSSKKNVFVKNL